MNKPKISIITATHRRPDLLYKCIKAIQLSTFTEYEHLVVGDHCSWAKRVCELFSDDSRIKYFETPSPHIWNAGACAKNVGIQNATTDYICYCDDDNIYLNNHLETMYEELSRGTQLCASKFYELPGPRGNSLKAVLEIPIPTDYNFSGGKAHYNDMLTYGHTKKLISQLEGWTAAEHIHGYHRDPMITGPSPNEDGHLIAQFKKEKSVNMVYIDKVTAIYYARGGCGNPDNAYDKMLDEKKLFAYPEIMKRNFGIGD